MQGGGMLISGSGIQVTISSTNIYQNTATAGSVRARLLLETPIQPPIGESDVTLCGSRVSFGSLLCVPMPEPLLSIPPLEEASGLKM